jgi:hypothetical protein
MKDEHFMRVWNEGHDHFSADITRGLKWLATPFRRLGERIALHRAASARAARYPAP